MILSDCFEVNEAGHLTVGGCDTVELARAYGTPLYVMDENAVRRNCGLYRDALRECTGGRGMALYASKAFCCKEVCRIAAEEGMGLDVVSGGEIATARAAGFPAERVFFHGNNKTRAEIDLALEYGVGRFVADNLEELGRLQRAAQEKGTVARVLLRVKPGVEAHTHAFIKTGQIDSKFGFALSTGEAREAAERALSLPNVELMGLHCHIGSQIFEIAPFLLAAERLLGLRKEIYRETGRSLPEMNLGGGYGIRYVEGDDPIPYGKELHVVAETVARRCAEDGMETPFLYLEPGRSIVGDAGLTLYEVGSVKTIPGVRSYVAVDGGMTDNPRYALYQAAYTAVVANKAAGPADFCATLAGKCCESGDLLQESAWIQKPEEGDLLAVLCTGAYNYSMASNYNRIPRPAVVMVRDGRARVIVRRETYEDLLRCDC